MKRILASNELRERLLIWEGCLYVVSGIRAVPAGMLRLVRNSYCYIHTSIGGAFIYPPGQGLNMVGGHRLSELDIEQFVVRDENRSRLLVIPQA